MEKKKITEARREANRRYDRKSYDTTLLRIRKDQEPTLATIRKAAESAGMSLNKFILEAIREKIQRESLPQEGKKMEERIRNEIYNGENIEKIEYTDEMRFDICRDGKWYHFTCYEVKYKDDPVWWGVFEANDGELIAAN